MMSKSFWFFTEGSLENYASRNGEYSVSLPERGCCLSRPLTFTFRERILRPTFITFFLTWITWKFYEIYGFTILLCNLSVSSSSFSINSVVESITESELVPSLPLLLALVPEVLHYVNFITQKHDNVQVLS